MNLSKTKVGLILASLGALSGAPASAQVDPNFHIYLAFGQSNMEGYANFASDYNSTDKQSLPRFQVLGATTCTNLQRTKDQWSPGIAPLFRCGTGLSPVDYFARTLVDSLPANIKIGIVPVAVAGTKIVGFDPAKYASYYAGEATWMQNIVKEYGGNPYGRLVAMAKIAQKSGVIKGILLHQGESDAGDQGTVWPNKVNTVYLDLIKDLGLKASEVPLLVGQLANNSSLNNVINGIKGTIPTAYPISSSGLGTHADDKSNLHFSAASYREFGKRYAQQMLKLLPKTTEVVRATPGISANADFVIFDVRGLRVAAFHAADLAAMESEWNTARKDLPLGVYWLRNSSTGFARKTINSR
ncbi:MAG: sialate O-acetylesterase [Fibrobacteria bacterium]|nr:sialate O-acetylesterase [Fibrobacteria bacterium]